MHGHYTCPLVKKEEPYHELAGHPLPCSMVNAESDSSLRILTAATHFPLLHKFVVLLYEAVRLHHQLDRIDTALCAGRLVQHCGLSDYKVLFKTAAAVRGCFNEKRSRNLNFLIPSFIQICGKC